LAQGEGYPVRAYRVFGLGLSSTFELPGVAPLEAAEPGVTLRLAADGEAAAAWPGGEALFEGKAHGEPLKLERSAEGSHRISHGQHTRFVIDSEAEQVLCAPADADGACWKRVLLDTVLGCVTVLRGREALHASAVHTRDGVVAMVAPSGTGKTSVAAALVDRGATLVCDDLLALERTGGQSVGAQPGAPVMSLPRVLADGWKGAKLAEFDGEAWVGAPACPPGPLPLAAICFLRRRAGLDQRVVPLQPSPLEVVPHLVDLALGPERERLRFELVCDLVETTPSFLVDASDAAAPEAIADLVERAAAGTAGGVAAG
jgi:hypothetical protein